jgi:hypothetical protein
MNLKTLHYHLSTFGVSYVGTIIGLITGYLIWGLSGVSIIGLLALLEVSLSLDNAVMNATVLKRMGTLARRLFLTVGILIAVFGMRALFPILLVATTSHLSLDNTWTLALHPNQTTAGLTYAGHLQNAHPAIAAFGGMFLFLVGLNFLFDSHRETRWINFVERPLARMGKIKWLSRIIPLGILLILAIWFAPQQSAGQVLIAGVLGFVSYTLIRGLSTYSRRYRYNYNHLPGETAAVTGKAAVFLFIYLEILDASFSFDGVIGAFSLTNNIFEIMIGLGIGAIFVRAMTLQLLRRGVMNQYKYLEHGAHYAIFFLGLVLFVSIVREVPAALSVLLSGTTILAAFITSLMAQRHSEQV